VNQHLSNQDNIVRTDVPRQFTGVSVNHASARAQQVMSKELSLNLGDGGQAAA
jgi:hypothetical protein